MRLFAALRPPREVLDHVETALAMLGNVPPAPRRNDRGERGTARRATLRSPWTPRTSWHITLAFFGSVPDGTRGDLEEAIDSAVGNLEPFTIHLAGAGTFRSTITWIGVGGQTEPLTRSMRVLGEIREEVTRTRDERVRNRAHLTISRAGAIVDSAQIAHALAIYRGPEWEVDSLDLVLSELGHGEQGHPAYTTLRSFPLGGR